VDTGEAAHEFEMIEDVHGGRRRVILLCISQGSREVDNMLQDARVYVDNVLQMESLESIGSISHLPST
jgi:hypothetical protein